MHSNFITVLVDDFFVFSYGRVIASMEILRNVINVRYNKSEQQHASSQQKFLLSSFLANQAPYYSQLVTSRTRMKKKRENPLHSSEDALAKNSSYSYNRQRKTRRLPYTSRCSLQVQVQRRRCRRACFFFNSFLSSVSHSFLASKVHYLEFDVRAILGGFSLLTLQYAQNALDEEVVYTRTRGRQDICIFLFELFLFSLAVECLWNDRTRGLAYGKKKKEKETSTSRLHIAMSNCISCWWSIVGSELERGSKGFASILRDEVALIFALAIVA